MPKILEDCVSALKAKGIPENSAFPICRSRLKLSKDGKMNDKEISEFADDVEKTFNSEPELKEINDVEIFASGVWNGDQFSKKDLDQIVETFNKTKDKLKPFLKIGHGNRQTLLAQDEMPKAGIIENVRRVGEKLLADFKDVPRKIYEVVKKRAYDRISSELFVNIPVDGQRHPLALKAVALLGGETPAVHDLNSILDLFASGGGTVLYGSENKTKEYDFDKSYFNFDREGDTMTVEELNRQNAKLEAEIKSYKEENAALEKDLEAAQKQNKEFSEKAEKLVKENSSLKGDIQAREKKFRESKVTSMLDEAVKTEKIKPSQKDLLFNLITSVEPNSETKTFSVNNKEYKSVEELVFAIIDAGQVDLNTSEHGGHEKPLTDDERAVKAAKQYAEKNNVSFTEALMQISK